MRNVTALSNPVNPPQLEEVYKFHNLKAERGELKPDQGRLRNTAVKSLTSVMGEDEPTDVESVLANLDQLINRWANKHPELKGGTAQTYGSRARAALEDFLRWKSDPAGFRFNLKKPTEKSSEKKPRVDEKKRPAPKMEDFPSMPPPPAAATPTSSSSSGEFRTFPLGSKGIFRFSLPEQPIKMRDVHRIALHLATFAEDFDPSNPIGATSSDIIK